MTISESLVYRRIAPVLLVLTFVVAIAAATGTYINDQADRRRDHAITEANTDRIADNARLLACFDDFATALAGGLPPVRAASADRDKALAAAFDANGRAGNHLKAALVRTLQQTVDAADVQAVVEAYSDLQAATKALHKANKHLEHVRAQNPYPAAPSTFCKS